VSISAHNVEHIFTLLLLCRRSLLSSRRKFYRFGGTMPLFLFIFPIFTIYIHSFNHIHTTHWSVAAIRRGLSPSLHLLFLRLIYTNNFRQFTVISQKMNRNTVNATFRHSRETTSSMNMKHFQFFHAIG
jgi:hypothetical protein